MPFAMSEMKGNPCMINIKNLYKTFSSAGGDITALSDINLDINDGEIFGIIGLSGAGKSTLVRCINLLERPTSGEVIIDGKDITKIPTKELLEVRQSIGMIFQSYNLLEQRNVLGNVLFPLEIAGVRKDEAKKRALDLIEMVGLSDRIKSYPSQLSGGQKQRVAIARALATKPKYLLCDEATSALDPNTTRSILDLIKQINREMGVTIIVITHEMKVIDSICDRVAVIDKSKIAELGRVSEVFTSPKSDIARELILPLAKKTEHISGGTRIRIVFDGEESTMPVISNLVLDCRVPVNIMYADTKDIDGRAFGQMVIEVENNFVSQVCDYLDSIRIKHEEVQ